MAARLGTILATITLAITADLAHASSSNFPLATTPVPFPSFAVGNADARLTGQLQHVTDGTASFYGPGINFRGRFAPLSGLAVGLELPFSYLSGNLGSDGQNGDESVSTISPVVNAQWLVIDSSSFSGILFGGLNFNYGWGSVAETSNGMPAKLSFTGTSKGFLAGAHLGIPIFDGIVFAPHYTYTRNYGGSSTASIALADGTTVTTTQTIGGFQSHGYGLDFIFPQPLLSIGALLQEILAAQNSGQALKVLMLEASWHFGVPKLGGSR